MKTRRLFLKLVVGITALFPFLKPKPTRKFINSAHRSEIVDLHLLSPNGDEWKIVAECPVEGFVFFGQEINNSWRNKFVADRVKNVSDCRVSPVSTLVCFDFDSQDEVRFRSEEMFKV